MWYLFLMKEWSVQHSKLCRRKIVLKYSLFEACLSVICDSFSVCGCALDMPELSEMTEQTDHHKATITNGLCLRRSEVLRSLRHYLQAWSQGSHHQSPWGERCRRRKHFMIFLERTWKGHRQSDEYRNCLKVNFGKLPRDKVECKLWAFLNA